MWGQNLAELFHRGGPVMYPLLACSMVALAIAIERFVVLMQHSADYDSMVGFLKRSSDDKGDTICDALRKRPDPLARVAEAYVTNLDSQSDIREKVVEQTASFQLTVLERRLHWLSIIGTVAPMIGLLGTVMGLVDAFHQIELLGGQVQPGDLASGIWSALLTTVCGLVIALPSLAAYHFFDQRVGAVSLRMQWLMSTLDKVFEVQLAERRAEQREYDVVASVTD